MHKPSLTPSLFCVSRVEVPPSGASAAATVEVDAASQASEPASQASDEEDVPSTDIYFVSSPMTPPPGPFALGLQGICGVTTALSPCDHSGWQGHCSS